MTETIDQRPLVTFALFAYNQEKYIREAVEGAFSQTYEPLEIILSDDCSSDRTFEIMQEMAAKYKGPHRVVARKNFSNLGLSAHLNEALRLAEGEIISWAAGDDIALPSRTAEFAATLINHPQCIAVHSGVQEIDLEGRRLQIRKMEQSQHHFDPKEVLRGGKSMTTQSHAFRKIAFDTFGPFRTDLTHEGFAMTFRESVLGEIVYIEKPLTLYRMGSGVSTYTGRDLQALKISEPIKISKWHYSAALQMLADIKARPDLFDKEMETIANRSIAFHRNTLSINSGKPFLIPLIHNFLMRPRDARSLRAFIRRFLPNRFYIYLQKIS